MDIWGIGVYQSLLQENFTQKAVLFCLNRFYNCFKLFIVKLIVIHYKVCFCIYHNWKEKSWIYALNFLNFSHVTKQNAFLPKSIFVLFFFSPKFEYLRVTWIWLSFSILFPSKPAWIKTQWILEWPVEPVYNGWKSISPTNYFNVGLKAIILLLLSKGVTNDQNWIYWKHNFQKRKNMSYITK